MTHTYRRVKTNTANIKLILGNKASKPEGSKCAMVTRRTSWTSTPRKRLLRNEDEVKAS